MQSRKTFDIETKVPEGIAAAGRPKVEQVMECCEIDLSVEFLEGTSRLASVLLAIEQMVTTVEQQQEPVALHTGAGGLRKSLIAIVFVK